MPSQAVPMVDQIVGIIVIIFLTPKYVVSDSARGKKVDYFNVHQKLIMDKVLEVYALEGPLSPVCKNHTMEFRRGLRNLEPWALLSKFFYKTNYSNNEKE